MGWMSAEMRVVFRGWTVAVIVGVGVNECSEQVGVRVENNEVGVEDIDKGWGFDSFVVNEETGLENQPSAKSKGKRKLSEVNYNDESDENCSGFDDSSDEDYHQPTNAEESSNESDSPSLVLEDIERESEEDIFQANNSELMKEFVVNDKDWCSEFDRDSDLETLHDTVSNIDGLPYTQDTVQSTQQSAKDPNTIGGGREYQGPRNDALLGTLPQANRRGSIRQRKPTIEQVLQNIRVKKRAWKP
ncbi:hypothetical protein Salat_1845400 [Sesamum alatum]|uniref:Uncharacterized protein n=1 Tax=Sesamum alatum TaxID=300844 RepID=A0AAE2CHX1_9LAMI|nr:hypothetical protein Salat_1845400 [Sesamum alatum]